VLALDVVAWPRHRRAARRDADGMAIPPRALGSNPAGPPASPLLKTGDAQFDERFQDPGSEVALHRLFDDGLRARTVATVDGWIAYWDTRVCAIACIRDAALRSTIPCRYLIWRRPCICDRRTPRLRGRAARRCGRLQLRRPRADMSSVICLRPRIRFASA